MFVRSEHDSSYPKLCTMMKLTILFVVAFALASAREVAKRDVLQFATMYACTVDIGVLRATTDYLGYGCYCGMGGSGTPVDETDECCYQHDQCYKQARKNGCGMAERYYIGYTYDTTEGPDGSCQVTCKAQADYPDYDDDAQCKAYMCNCDRKGADCFAKARSTFKTKYIGYSNFWCLF